jgi:protein involved in polysaccharide export with SLBB domain
MQMKLGCILLMGFFSATALAQTQPASPAVTVAGAIKKPGVHQMTDKGLTLLQILTLSSGLLPNADTSKIEVVRQKQQEPNGNASETIVINLRNILLGRAPDFPLQSGDAVFIPARTRLRIAR